MRCMSQYVANKNVFSECLKLSLPTAGGSLKLSGREFYTDGPATAMPFGRRC